MVSHAGAAGGNFLDATTVVANGQDAGIAWEALIRGRVDQSEHADIKKALLAYCSQDTMALVRLVGTLFAESGARSSSG